MSVARLLSLASVAGVLACYAARAETFDHLSVSATPSVYEGPCPVSIKLESVIKFDVSFNRQEQYVYRWEGNEQLLTDDVAAYSKGRINKVEATVQIREPVGKSMTIAIRLHASWGKDFAKTAPYYGMAVNDHYSSPATVTITCR